MMDISALGDFVNDLFKWVTSFGPVWLYLAIVLASFIENIFPPFPGDTVTIAGAALAAYGKLAFPLVFVAAYLGGIISTMLIYWFGRRHGYGYFREKNFKIFPADKLDELRLWLERQGIWLILASRFVVGVRTLIVLVAGIGHWPVSSMLFFSSVSFWIFNALLMYLTYLFVNNLELLSEYIKLYQYYVLGILVIILFWAARRYLRSRRS